MSHAKAGSPFGTMEKMGNEKAKKKNKGGKKAKKKQNQMVEKFMLIFSVPRINDFTLFFAAYHFLSVFTLLWQTYIMTLIALERYLIICHPHRVSFQ